MRPTLGARAPRTTPFAFAAAGHPLFAALAPLRAIIASDPRLRPSGAPGELVRADLRVVAGAGGAWEIERMYWSVQRPEPGAPGALSARMLLVDRRRGGPPGPVVHDFPDDPRLPAAVAPEGPLVAGHDGAPVEVLRYIPVGRITFRTAGAGAALIGKIKAPSSLRRARALLEAVRAALPADATFAVARPLEIEDGDRVLFQTLCPGRPLAHVGDGTEADAALHRLGTLHREIHALDVDAPADDEDERWADLRADLAWIACAAPAEAGAAARIQRWVEANLRYCGDGGRRFCHGDYSPSQILRDGDAWTVLDFDDAHRGDPYADVAATLVSLEHEIDTPEPPDAATVARREAAYLAGYGPLDERRLRAHCVAQRVALVAQRLRKDRATAEEPARVLGGLLRETGG